MCGESYVPACAGVNPALLQKHEGCSVFLPLVLGFEPLVAQGGSVRVGTAAMPSRCSFGWGLLAAASVVSGSSKLNLLLGVRSHMWRVFGASFTPLQLAEQKLC